MKKIFLIIFCFLNLKINAQQHLKFDKRFVECEDKWISFRMSEDSTYDFGFIYIDAQAGLTFNREGHFSYVDQKVSNVQKMKDANIKVRLEPNNVKVALIPEAMYKDLQISKYPDWLKYYKNDTVSAKHFYQWGYKYNEWKECERALPFLLRAQAIDPEYTDLNTELAFTYNCLKEYSKAEEILEKEIKVNPTDYCIKEYIYTCIQSKHIDKAIAQYQASAKKTNDDVYRAENCFNILGHYFKKGDRTNFELWYDELQKCKNNNPMITKLALQLKEELNKK